MNSSGLAFWYSYKNVGKIGSQLNCNLGLKWQTSHDPDVENSGWKQLEWNNDDNWERYKEIDRVATITFECGQWITVM